MTRTGIPRRLALSVVCVAAVLAAPAAAASKPPPLSTHSASSSTPNSDGQLVATAKCGSHEGVVSGGYTSPNRSSALVSAAPNGHSWTVYLVPGSAGTLTTYAYCMPKARISPHESEGKAVPAPANTVVASRCPAGKTLVSGGYAVVPQLAPQDASVTYRDYASTARSWAVMAAITGPSAQLAVFAYCKPGVVVRVRSASSSPIPGGGGEGTAMASCHKGETLLGGGYTTTPLPDWDNNIGPDFSYSLSRRQGLRSWVAGAVNSSNVNSMTAGTITAFAYCER